MMTMFCYLGGVGVQELLLIALFPIYIGIPVAIIVLVIRLTQRKPFINPGYHAATTPSGDSPILKNAGKLRELKSLQEKGIISREEFEAEKRKLLDS